MDGKPPDLWSGRHGPGSRGQRSQSLPALPAMRCRGRFWLVLKDPCGLACAFITYFVALGTASLVNFCCLLPRLDGLFTLLHVLAYNYTVAILAVSHVRCMCTNPGTAREHLETELIDAMRDEFRRVRTLGEAPASGGPGHRRWWCTKCDTFRPKHTHHCSQCGACVLEMDHHCPWVNNCVGWRNHKYFIIFLVHAWVACVWSASVMLYTLSLRPELSVLGEGDTLFSPEKDAIEAIVAPWVMGGWRWPRMICYASSVLYDNFWLQLSCVLASVLCLVLWIFTCVMFFDQWEYMARGYGVVGRKLKQLEAKNGTEPKDGTSSPEAASSVPRLSEHHSTAGSRWGCPKLPQVMGGPFGLAWFLPLQPEQRDVAHPPEADAFVNAVLARWRGESDEACPEKSTGDTDTGALPPSPAATASTSSGSPRRRHAAQHLEAEADEAQEARTGWRPSPHRAWAATEEAVSKPVLRGRKAALAQAGMPFEAADREGEEPATEEDHRRIVGLAAQQGLRGRKAALARIEAERSGKSVVELDMQDTRDDPSSLATFVASSDNCDWIEPEDDPWARVTHDIPDCYLRSGYVASMIEDSDSSSEDD
eukprot:TRINITY_DN51944_c0_g1_i1.p1 TRINITY_DN51944_c0_g1~~TRINITY_DN51944_c0_g1_i1.p1  ORF type:complete len:594 (-),score=118.15 TRINITY_DN51944_c0_g1_i1:72-1853(-)